VILLRLFDNFDAFITMWTISIISPLGEHVFCCVIEVLFPYSLITRTCICLIGVCYCHEMNVQSCTRDEWHCWYSVYLALILSSVLRQSLELIYFSFCVEVSSVCCLPDILFTWCLCVSYVMLRMENLRCILVSIAPRNSLAHHRCTKLFLEAMLTLIVYFIINKIPVIPVK